jgi:hypothetical protein
MARVNMGHRQPATIKYKNWVMILFFTEQLVGLRWYHIAVVFANGRGCRDYSLTRGIVASHSIDKLSSLHFIEGKPHGCIASLRKQNTNFFWGRLCFQCYLIVSFQKLHKIFPPSEYQDDLYPILRSEANSWSLELMRSQSSGVLDTFNTWDSDYIRRPFSWTLFTLESTEENGAHEMWISWISIWRQRMWTSLQANSHGLLYQ